MLQVLVYKTNAAQSINSNLSVSIHSIMRLQQIGRYYVESLKPQTMSDTTWYTLVLNGDLNAFISTGFRYNYYNFIKNA